MTHLTGAGAELLLGHVMWYSYGYLFARRGTRVRFGLDADLGQASASRLLELTFQVMTGELSSLRAGRESLLRLHLKRAHVADRARRFEMPAARHDGPTAIIVDQGVDDGHREAWATSLLPLTALIPFSGLRSVSTNRTAELRGFEVTGGPRWSERRVLGFGIRGAPPSLETSYQERRK
jgi:hypothetical protein